jgi:hypothetical protein
MRFTAYIILLFLLLFCGADTAQNYLTIRNADGSLSNAATSWVKKITFSADATQMNIYLSNAQQITQTTTAVSKMSFDNSGSGVALPVELTSFTASPGGKTVNLKWQTATEINSARFEIERMDGTNTKWNTIATLKGAGNSTIAHTYTYSDKSVVSGKYVYRLKMVDNDGTARYSAVSEAQVGIPQTFALQQNYPNPFNPSTRIAYSLPSKGFVKLQVYSITGQLVKTIVQAQQEAGYYTADFSAADMSSGVYMYILSVDTKTIVKKMLLMK